MKQLQLSWRYVSDGCCGSTARPGHFHCHGCGHCCTSLQDRWARDRGRFTALPRSGIYRVPTPGGLRMFSWEAGPFPRGRLAPMLVVADARSEQPVALAYEMDAAVCPRYEEGTGCTIYEDRPMVCRAYPLLVLEGDAGPEVAASGLCPAKVPIVGAAKASSDPARVLAGLYPNEAAAALSVPALVSQLGELVAYLEAADVLAPVTDLDERDVQAWLARDVLDLVEVVEEAGVLRREELVERARATWRRVGDRLLDA